MKVYLSEEQYKKLLNEGSITVGGTTVIYNPNDDYITPLDVSKFLTVDNIYVDSDNYLHIDTE